jgi:dephospho-CoA kinase
MAFIYITGAPGIGKSTLQNELTKLNYQVYDLDDSQFGGPHNKASGEKVVIPPVDEREDDWFDRHEWRIYRSAFEGLKQGAKNKIIIVCGVAEADHEITDLFDKILYLKVSDEVLTERIAQRVKNDYGHNQSELLEIMNRKHKLDAKYQGSSNVIDASGSIQETVARILKAI